MKTLKLIFKIVFGGMLVLAWLYGIDMVVQYKEMGFLALVIFLPFWVLFYLKKK